MCEVNILYTNSGPLRANTVLCYSTQYSLLVFNNIYIKCDKSRSVCRISKHVTLPWEEPYYLLPLFSFNGHFDHMNISQPVLPWVSRRGSLAICGMKFLWATPVQSRVTVPRCT